MLCKIVSIIRSNGTYLSGYLHRQNQFAAEDLRSSELEMGFSEHTMGHKAAEHKIKPTTRNLMVSLTMVLNKAVSEIKQII